MKMNRDEGATLKEIDIEHEKRKKRGYHWLVEFRFNGKRVRKYFKHGHKKEAEAHKAEIERQADEVGKCDRDLLDADLLNEAVEARKALSPFGESIADAVAFYVDHLEAKAKQALKQKQAALKQKPALPVGGAAGPRPGGSTRWRLGERLWYHSRSKRRDIRARVEVLHSNSDISIRRDDGIGLRLTLTEARDLLHR